MSRDISNIKQWRLWRDVVVKDTFLTDYKPADFDSVVQSKSVYALPGTVLAVRAWGLGSVGWDNTIRFSGWMDPNSSRGSGPGQVLWAGNTQLGTRVFSSADVLYTGGSPQTWRTVDRFATGSASLYANPSVLGGGGIPAHDDSLFLLPTLGYPYILCEINNIGDGGYPTRLTILVREAMRGEVVPGFHTTAI